jgi:glycosyltransferase involved in cell wall biosynthesis
MQKTGIVIPCFNEADRLNVKAFTKFIGENESIEFLFVNDGSTDDTLRVLEGIRSNSAGRAMILDLKANQGKAEAVRQGLLHMFSLNKYSYVGFWDADLATPLNEINRLLSAAAYADFKIVLGCRLKRLGANVERRAQRHILGRVFSTFASLILKLPVYDTQCGAKLFHQSTKELFNEKFITKWLFDIEILARYRNLHGIERALLDLYEYPISTWVEIGGSKLRSSHMLKVPFELLRIKRKYNS